MGEPQDGKLVPDYDVLVTQAEKGAAAQLHSPETQQQSFLQGKNHMKTVSKGNFNAKGDWKRLQMRTVFRKQFLSGWNTMRPYPQLK